MLSLEVLTYLGRDERSRVQSLPITRVTLKLDPSGSFPPCEAQALSRAQKIFYILSRQKILLDLSPVVGL